jgi:hypothetical protein
LAHISNLFFISFRWKIHIEEKRPQGILTYEKDATMVAWMLGVQECELSIISYYNSSK